MRPISLFESGERRSRRRHNQRADDKEEQPGHAFPEKQKMRQ